MIKPFRATYGAKDNSHSLLDWNGGLEKQPPKTLLGLTDKPSGNVTLGEVWWPAFGCGPVDDWWAIWWTVPDKESSRSGMVRSEVSLWPLTEIHDINDLTPFIEELLQEGFNVSNNPDLLGETVEALLSTSNKTIVIQNQYDFPSIVNIVWKKLWPAARTRFSARSALTPPQSTRQKDGPLLYCVPHTHINQWRRNDFDIIVKSPSKLSRPAKYFTNEKDIFLEEVLTDCPPNTADITYLTKAARCADRLELFRRDKDVQSVLNLARSVVALSPTKGSGHKLKEEPLSYLNDHLTIDDISIVLSFANFNENSVDFNLLPIKSIKIFLNNNLLTMSTSSFAEFVSRLSAEQVQIWWKDCVLYAIKQVVSLQTKQSFRLVLSWLGLNHASELLLEFIPSNSYTEEQFLIATNHIDMELPEIENVKKFTMAKQWPRLHAWTLLKTIPEHETFHELIASVKHCEPGLEFLVDNLSGATVIEEALSDSPHISMEQAAQRTANEPSLILNIDISKPKARQLWFNHILAGGEHWPLGINRDAFKDAFIIEVLSDHDTGVVQALSTEVAKTVLLHEERKNIWSCLSPIDEQTLSNSVADIYLSDIAPSMPLEHPEDPLAQSILDKLLTANNLPATSLLHCLTWNKAFRQTEIIKWVNKVPTNEWSVFAKELGTQIKNKSWSDVAAHLYELCLGSINIRSAHSLMPALFECYSLLSPFKQLMIKMQKHSSHSNYDEKLAKEISRIGNEIAYDRLESIWRSAGGQTQDLKYFSYSKERWDDAVKKAISGKLSSGLKGLVKALLEEFPHNKELKALKLYVK
jgi:hypothetical protein